MAVFETVRSAYVLGVANNVYRRLQIGNASLSVAVVVEGAARLITLNDTSHLDGLTAG
jgi:broad specificity phosphatase PhoE